MKRLLFTLLFFLPILAGAQITIDHTFNNETRPVAPITINNTIYYYTFNVETNQIKIFKSDYSVYKTISISLNTGFKLSMLNQFSTNLFNSDLAIEFLVYSYQIDNSANFSSKLFNENGDMLKDFGNRNSAYIFKTGTQTKLSISGYTTINSVATYITDIYNLPGNLPTNSNDLNTDNIDLPYPNPSNSIIYIPYKLNNGHTSIMSIYNISGQLIERFQINSKSENVLINLNSYQPGIYIYEYDGFSNRFIVN